MTKYCVERPVKLFHIWGIIYILLLVPVFSSSLAADLDDQASQNTFYGVAERIRGFDPVTAGDVAASLAIGRIYEGLLQYSYLARPYQVEPSLCEKMPDISTDGLIYTFTIRKGIYFQDDPCFVRTGGKGREVTAEDFVYAIKRVADIKTSSTGYWAFNNRVVGLDEFHAVSAGEQPTDYDKNIEGLCAPERYTLRIRLKEPYPQLLWILTMHYTFAVPREAVEYYGADFVNHPVGTGPYCLKSWTRNYRIEYVRNPKWKQTGRIERYPGKLAARFERPIPFIDRIVEYVINDTTTRWCMFLKGQLELSGISRDNWDAVITSSKTLNNELAALGIQMHSTPVMETYYIGFNMDDPVVGNNKYLRQALSCAFDTEPYIRFYNNRVIRAVGPIPPGIAGFENQASPYPYNLDKARALLAKAGYAGGKDPKTGRRLKLNLDIGNANDPEVRASVELFTSFMDKIGIQIAPVYNNWPTFLSRLERKQTQMFRLGWVADYPDAENFLQLFYGPNCSPGPNHCNYINKSFDTLYEHVRVMSDSPERTKIYQEMAAMVIEDCPWIFEQHPLAYGLRHSWLKNYKPHDFPYGMNKYYAIDYLEREQRKKQRGSK